MTTIQIQNKQGKVKLTEVVDGFSISKVIEEIGRLFGAKAAADGADFGVIMNAAENAVDVLDIEINSPGGSIFDGYTMYQEIKSLRERGVVVNVKITGMAASMASVIAMAADKVSIVPHGRMMIHDASQAVVGNAEKHMEAAKLLDGLSQDIANIYAEKTGKDPDDIRAMMKKETWMNAKEAVKMGFADEIFDIRASKPKSEAMNWLAKLLPDKADEIAKFEASIAESESLRNELETAQAKITELQGMAAVIAEKDEEIKNLATAKAEFEAKVADFTKQIEAKDEEIKTIADSIPAKIAEALAQVGQPEPLPSNDSSTNTSETKTRKEFDSLDHIARNAFIARGGKIV